MTLAEVLYIWYPRDSNLVHRIIRETYRGRYVAPERLVIELARANPSLFRHVETLSLPGENALGVSRIIYPPLEKETNV